jgi:hypothetical protein
VLGTGGGGGKVLHRQWANHQEPPSGRETNAKRFERAKQKDETKADRAKRKQMTDTTS